MLIATTDYLPGATYQILGLVRGNVVTTKNVGRDIMASARAIAGGEVKSYTLMTSEARDIAQQRMIDEATKLGANAIIGMRFASETPTPGMTDMLAYGTAIRLEK